MRCEITALRLAAPLFYRPEPCQPFERQRGERLFCFALDPAGALAFEPPAGVFPGRLTGCGRAAGGEGEGADRADQTLALPAGDYLFAQTRERLDQDRVIEMAVEIQQEALWRRLQPCPVYYLRFLSEEGAEVTQVFRPLENGSGDFSS